MGKMPPAFLKNLKARGSSSDAGKSDPAEPDADDKKKKGPKKKY